MKKILFNDKFNLTEAVLSGRKTQTRRLITCPKTVKGQDVFGFYVQIRQSDGSIPFWPCTYDADEATIDGGEILPKYKVGEVVAVAQSYKDAGVNFIPEEDEEFGCYNFPAEQTNGWTNKMFTRASLLPHQIRITNVRVERLRDISDADCIKEGVVEACVSNNWGNSATHWEYNVPYEDKVGRAKLLRGMTPQEAYAALIDRISGKGDFQSNPWVFVYDFELVK